jgi:hypothetical protein
MKARVLFRYAGLALLGTAILFSAINALAIHARKVSTDLLLMQMALEENSQAGIAELRGDKLSAMGHRFAETALWEHYHNQITSLPEVYDFWFTFRAASDPVPHEGNSAGTLGFMGLAYAKLAQVLEWNGYNTEADSRWDRAATLIHESVPKLRCEPNLLERARILGIDDANPCLPR